MTLNRIANSNLVSQAGVERFKEAVQRDQADQKNDSLKKAPGAARPDLQDRAEISETARRLMDIRQTMESGLDAMEALPEVRDNKVAEARQRLAKGFYHSVQVTNEVAEKLNRTFDAIDEL